jgi:hypothetical protein
VQVGRLHDGAFQLGHIEGGGCVIFRCSAHVNLNLRSEMRQRRVARGALLQRGDRCTAAGLLAKEE